MPARCQLLILYPGKPDPGIEFTVLESGEVTITSSGTAGIDQAIIDIATEYSLVTDYTSMVVVRDEVFESLGIKRENKKRLQTEQAAQQKRAAQPAVSQRADTQQPMFNSNRASHSSGSGAMDGWLLLLILPALLKRKFGKDQSR